MDKSIQEKINRLGNLTSKMDIPASRHTSIDWLSRNLSVRNSNHENFKEAIELVKQLKKLGVQ
jgi:hypothetical protein